MRHGCLGSEADVCRRGDDALAQETSPSTNGPNRPLEGTSAKGCFEPLADGGALLSAADASHAQRDEFGPSLHVRSALANGRKPDVLIEIEAVENRQAHVRIPVHAGGAP